MPAQILRVAVFAAGLVLVVACTDTSPAGPGSTPRSPATTRAPSTAAPETAGPAPTQAAVVGGPPMGIYQCRLVPQYIYNGYVELVAPGAYEAGFTRGEPTTQGAYSFDAQTRRIHWSGGSYADNWPVAYYVEPGVYPDGTQRTGTGSDRHTIALLVDQSSSLLPGQEVGANPVYSYCYLEEG